MCVPGEPPMVGCQYGFCSTPNANSTVLGHEVVEKGPGRGVRIAALKDGIPAQACHGGSPIRSCEEVAQQQERDVTHAYTRPEIQHRRFTQCLIFARRKGVAAGPESIRASMTGRFGL